MFYRHTESLESSSLQFAAYRLQNGQPLPANSRKDKDATFNNMTMIGDNATASSSSSNNNENHVKQSSVNHGGPSGFGVGAGIGNQARTILGKSNTTAHNQFSKPSQSKNDATNAPNNSKVTPCVIVTAGSSNSSGTNPSAPFGPDATSSRGVGVGVASEQGKNNFQDGLLPIDTDIGSYDGGFERAEDNSDKSVELLRSEAAQVLNLDAGTVRCVSSFFVIGTSDYFGFLENLYRSAGRFVNSWLIDI